MQEVRAHGWVKVRAHGWAKVEQCRSNCREQCRSNCREQCRSNCREPCREQLPRCATQKPGILEVRYEFINRSELPWPNNSDFRLRQSVPGGNYRPAHVSFNGLLSQRFPESQRHAVTFADRLEFFATGSKLILVLNFSAKRQAGG